jgi:hypothetical protein
MDQDVADFRSWHLCDMSTGSGGLYMLVTKIGSKLWRYKPSSTVAKRPLASSVEGFIISILRQHGTLFYTDLVKSAQSPIRTCSIMMIPASARQTKDASSK